MKLEYVEIGQIVNTHGVRGEVKLNPWEIDPELLRRAADELHAALPGGYLCPLPADAVPEFCAPAGETEN